jgi:hypothetical protein
VVFDSSGLHCHTRWRFYDIAEGARVPTHILALPISPRLSKQREEGRREFNTKLFAFLARYHAAVYDDLTVEPWESAHVVPARLTRALLRHLGQPNPFPRSAPH